MMASMSSNAGRSLRLLAASLSASTAILSLSPQTASAQSSGTQALEEITVVGRSQKRVVSPLIAPEVATKARSSINQDFILRQAPGQTVLQNVNLLPGLNFTNNDAYGNSGGNIRLRSYDGPRVSLTLDGMPLNDSGNYAIFSNQLVDGEVLDKATVNSGTTDVDSPTASATGGVINYTTRKPTDEAGVSLATGYGSNNYKRGAVVVNTGLWGGTGIKSWLEGSYTNYDKFKGPGDQQKLQGNFKVIKEFAGGDMIGLAGHYNQNRNYFLRNPSLAQWYTQGYAFENFGTFYKATPRPGLTDDDNLGSANNPGENAAGSNFYGIRINPSDTANLRANGMFHITKNIRLTVDPSIQYTLANGGGTTAILENDARLIGGTTSKGVDLNGDGDVLDRVRVFTPNNTHTIRPAVNSSGIWEIDDNNRVRVSYAWERARHRQTSQWALLDPNGFPTNEFAGLKRSAIMTADGSQLRGRDRKSYAELNQISADYAFSGFGDTVKLNIGIRAPEFHRELNQYCWTLQNTPSGGTLSSNQYCTGAAAPPATTLIRLAPYSAVKNYSDTLPNVGASYRFLPDHLLFASYAKSLSAPRTDNLYGLTLPNVQPETSDNFDVGYRYQADSTIASLTGWMSTYHNRIVTSFDPDTSLSIDRNVGDVKLSGVELEVGSKIYGGLSGYLSASYINSEVQNNLQISSTQFEATKGKSLAETPDYQFAGRLDYRMDAFSFGLQGKYVGKRFSTDVNDQYARAYYTIDLDARYQLPQMMKWQSAWIQFNAINLLDRAYLGSISSQTRANAVVGLPSPGTPTYAVAAPRTFMVSLRADF